MAFMDGDFVAAKTASSPTDFVSKLVDFGLSATSETQAFAEEILARVPRKTSGVNVSYCCWYFNVPMSLEQSNSFETFNFFDKLHLIHIGIFVGVCISFIRNKNERQQRW